jgi:hypothetical protein
MSEHVNLVRSIYADWERGVWTSAAWARSDVEFAVADGPEPGVVRGVPAMAESWQQWLSAWEDYRLEAEEYRELDEERVLVLHRYSGRGRASRLEIGQVWTEAATVFTVREDKVSRIAVYNDRDRALADLGLEE